MKLNKYFMLGLAGLAFAACSNEEDVIDNGNHDGKVYVNLSLGSAETRSLTQSAADLKNDIDNVKIYFYTAGGNYVTDIAPDANAAEGSNSKALATALETLKTAKETEVQLTEIPSSANTIYIVANEPAANPINKESVDKAKGSTINLADQVITNPVRFSGEKSTLTGHATLQASTLPVDGKPAATADVKLIPVPSRIEVQNFIATTKPADYNGSEIQSFDVTGIYINAFYTQGYLDKAASIDAAKIDYQEDAAKYSKTTGYTNYGFMCDELTSTDYSSEAYTTDGAIWKVSPILAGQTTPYWGYQVLRGDVPHMVVKMDVIYNGSSNKEVRYLTITGYKKTGTTEALSEVKRGEVYRMTDLKFTAADLTPTPYEKTKTVTADVEVLAWVGVEVDPVL